MSPILADAGVPMVMFIFPAAFFLLVPIVGIETWVARRVSPVPANRRVVGVLVANAVSTIAGWFLTWIVLALLQLFVIPGGQSGYNFPPPYGAIAAVTLQAPWLMPYEDQLYWMVPTAAMVLMIPAFFVSVLTEGFVLRFFWRETAAGERRSFAWVANLASYALLYVFGIGWLLYWIFRFHKHA
jgi:hypothetical protein